MANRRMFSLDVVNTDKFMEMPLTAQALYFHLGMRADDDGFVSSPRQVMKAVECKQDDMKILLTKGYIIPFESGVIVISHWRQNNYVRCDRYTQSRHIAEMNQLVLENGVYTIGIPNDIPSDIPAVYPDKIRLDKTRIDKKTICSEPEQSAPSQSGILLPLNDKSFYDVPLANVSMWEESYPAVDIKQELRKMIAWLNSNPTKRKTRRGIDRFINSWLSREQDKGGSRQQVQKPVEYQQSEHEKELYEMYGRLSSYDGEDAPFK